MKVSSRKIVIGVMIAAIILICVAWKILQWNESRITSYNFSEELISEEFCYNIDNVTNTEGFLEISGWIYKPGEEIKTAEMYVILKNTETGECYKMPTEVVARKDVTKAVNDGIKYDMCGFKSYAHLDNTKLVQNQDYQIYILYHSNRDENLVSLNETVKGWSN